MSADIRDQCRGSVPRGGPRPRERPGPRPPLTAGRGEEAADERQQSGPAHGPWRPRRTVVRIGLSLAGGGTPTVTDETVIGTGLPERTDPAALVVGPTGLGLSRGTLYIADSLANRIAKIPGATATPGAITTVTSGGAVNDPLGLAIAPNGDILTTNGGDGNLVETTPQGRQVAVKILDTSPAPPGPNGNGTLFGLAVVPDGSGVYFVDDGTNTLDLLH
jgi:hypothetical protein